MKPIDIQAIVDEHAAITDRAERVRQTNATLSAVEDLRITLVRMRRADLTELVYEGEPGPLARGRISDVAREVKMGRGRVREIIGSSPADEESDAETADDRE